MQNELENFIQNYENKVVKLSKEANEKYFQASISGKEEDYHTASELQTKLSKIYTNKDDFKKLKEFKENASKTGITAEAITRVLIDPIEDIAVSGTISMSLASGLTVPETRT